MTKALYLILLAAAMLPGATPKLTFTKSFPASSPPYTFICVDKTGAVEYKESLGDDQPLHIQLDQSATDDLFALADKLGYFKTPLESGLKVANTGKKTFRYADDNGGLSEQTFNYSLDPSAQQLWDKFENIASSERAYLDLDSRMRFDKLGVNDALAEIEFLWVRKQLAAREQFIPLFTRIVNHESFMHLVRDRAARLKDEFTAPAATASK